MSQNSASDNGSGDLDPDTSPRQSNLSRFRQFYVSSAYHPGSTAGRIDRFAQTMGASIRLALIVFAAAALPLAWLTEAIMLLPKDGPIGVLLPLFGTIITLAGGLYFTVRVPKSLRLVQLAGCVVVMEGGFSFYLQTVHLDPQLPDSTSSFAISVFKVAMVLFAGAAGPRLVAVILPIATLLVAEFISVTLSPKLNYPWQLDPAAIAALLFAVGAALGIEGARIRAVRTSRLLDAVAREDNEQQLRERARIKAAAAVHDTVLNDLAVLATTDAGRVSPRVLHSLSATLEMLASPDWAADSAADDTPGASGAVMQRAIDRATENGTSVRILGDPGVLAELPANIESALGQAVDQCLVNIQRHSGSAEAEITVISDGSDISVMVADAGSGFDLEAVDSNRMGLRGSIRSRLEDIGGSVRIFTRAGVGTTIFLSVPIGTDGPSTTPGSVE